MNTGRRTVLPQSLWETGEGDESNDGGKRGGGKQDVKLVGRYLSGSLELDMLIIAPELKGAIGRSSRGAAEIDSNTNWRKSRRNKRSKLQRYTPA